VQEGHLVYEHNNFGSRTFLRSLDPIPTGQLTVGVDQQRIKRGPAATRLWVGDDLVGEGVIGDLAVMISSIGLTIGSNPSGVSDAYTTPFVFDGSIERLVIDTERALRPEDEDAAEIRAAYGTQ
jgi:hypothetical protein